MFQIFSAGASLVKPVHIAVTVILPILHNVQRQYLWDTHVGVICRQFRVIGQGVISDFPVVSAVWAGRDFEFGSFCNAVTK